MKSIKPVLAVLREIYPPYLVLLVFIPVFTGFFIDYELSDSRDIIINLLWMPLFTIPNIWFRKKVIYQLTCLVYFLVGLIGMSHWIILKGPLTLTSLLVISNTNIQEAIEFLDLKATVGLLILVPYIYLFYLSLHHYFHYHLSKIGSYLIGFILLVSFGFILENAIHVRLVRKGTPQIVKVTCAFITQINLFEEAMQEIAPHIVEANTTFDTGGQIFVLILGESCNRNHMSLYHSPRNTTPKLKKRNDIIVFNNVVSPYSNTLNSVLSLFSNSGLEQKIDFGTSIDLIDVFHSAGFKTYWISNQSPIGIWDNMVTVLAKKSDYFKFVNTTSNSSFEAILTTSYDSKIFEPFIKALHENVPNKFIVLHLMGSHSSYLKRYPPAFDIFRGSDSKEETIAEYDNSVLYNDFIIDSLLNIISADVSLKNNQPATAIYLSDHGENVYDESDQVGHDYSKEMPKADVEIPFLVWLSPTFEKLEPGKAITIKSNINKPFVSDDLFYSVIDLNGIKGPYLLEDKSIFSSKFNDRRKRILEDGKDYDEK